MCVIFQVSRRRRKRQFQTIDIPTNIAETKLPSVSTTEISADAVTTTTTNGDISTFICQNIK